MGLVDPEQIKNKNHLCSLSQGAVSLQYPASMAPVDFITFKKFLELIIDVESARHADAPPQPEGAV